MPTPRNIFLLALIAITSASAAHSQKPSSRPQEVFAPYWTSEPGWETELQLKNNLASGPLTVTPVLRLATGEETALDPVTIASNASVSVWVNEELLKRSSNLLSEPGSYGSLVFRFTSFNARNLYAGVVLSLRGGPIEFRVPAHPPADFAAWPRAAGPGSQEGIWWQPRSGQSDVLVVSNSSAKPLAATLWLSAAAGNRWSRAVTLPPHQTERLDLRDLLRASGLSGTYGGIKVEVPAYSGALHSFHFAYDEVAQTSASLKMFTRDPGAKLSERIAYNEHRSWTMWAPMLPLQMPDPVLGLPAATVLQPTIFVRNATAKAAIASLKLEWRGDSGKGSAKLPDLTLAPFETRQIQISPLQKQLGIPSDAHWALVTLTSPGSPDDLLAVATSYDSSGRYGTESAFSDNLGNHFEGGQWRADATHNHIIVVTNSGQKATDALLTLHYNHGGENVAKNYEMQQTIQPGEQMWVNVADLIRNRIADRKGKVLPVDLSTGTYELRDLGARPGALMIASITPDNGGAGIGHPSAECCGIESPSFDPDFFAVEIDGMWDPFATVATEACSGQRTDISSEMISFWATNTAIA